MQAIVDCFFEEPVAIRKEDWPAINQAIADAIAPLRPRGWRKFFHITRDLGITAAVITAFVGTIGIVIAVTVFASNGITKNAEFRTHTEDRLTNIESGIKDLQAQLSNLSLKHIADGPTTPSSLAEAKKLVSNAASKSIRLDQSAISSVGGKIIQASQNNPAAWGVAVGFLNYKSFLDSFSLPVIEKSSTRTTNYALDSFPGDPLPTMRVVGTVSKDMAARADHIGTNQNAGLSEGDQYIIATGGGVSIDGMELKNVILTNVNVHYRGGPLKLTNVYFINCSFDVERVPTGENFANVFLQSGPSTTFTAA